MKKILMLQWFNCKDDIRRQELTDCIRHNLSIGFDEVVIFNDSVEPIFHDKNVKNILKLVNVLMKIFKEALVILIKE